MAKRGLAAKSKLRLLKIVSTSALKDGIFQKINRKTKQMLEQSASGNLFGNFLNMPDKLRQRRNFDNIRWKNQVTKLYLATGQVYNNFVR